MREFLWHGCEELERLDFDHVTMKTWANRLHLTAHRVAYLVIFVCFYTSGDYRLALGFSGRIFCCEAHLASLSLWSLQYHYRAIGPLLSSTVLITSIGESTARFQR